jgi:hypothetical protein
MSTSLVYHVQGFCLLSPLYIYSLRLLKRECEMLDCPSILSGFLKLCCRYVYVYNLYPLNLSL